MNGKRFVCLRKDKPFPLFVVACSTIIVDLLTREWKGDFRLKLIKLLAMSLCSLVFFTGCMASNTAPIDESSIEFVQLEEIQDGRETAVITTTEGTITMVLFEKEAPKTVAHFKKLIQEGFYNDKPLYSQSGPHTFVTGADSEDGSTGKLVTNDGNAIECEVSQNLWHFKGAVSAYGYEKSKLSRQMLSDSRFFIVGNIEATTDMVTQMEDAKYPMKVINAYKEHGGLPHYTGLYTVFGQVIEGMDVVDRLSQMAIDEENGMTVDAKVLKIELSTYHKPEEDTASSSEENISK